MAPKNHRPDVRPGTLAPLPGNSIHRTCGRAVCLDAPHPGSNAPRRLRRCKTESQYSPLDRSLLGHQPVHPSPNHDLPSSLWHLPSRTFGGRSAFWKHHSFPSRHQSTAVRRRQLHSRIPLPRLPLTASHLSGRLCAFGHPAEAHPETTLPARTSENHRPEGEQ